MRATSRRHTKKRETMKKETVILFDLDGTLIDSTEAILESFAQAFERFETTVPEPGAITAMIGEPLSVMFSKLGVHETQIDEYVAAYKAHYRRISREKTHLLPGAREAVELASSFARLGVVTTKTGRYAVELLEHLGLMPYFEVLIGSEDVIRHKPHPEPVLKALRLMDAEGDRAWMIGDTPMDIEAAFAAGIEPCGVCCGYADERELRRGCERVFPTALAAVTWLASKEEIESLL